MNAPAAQIGATVAVAPGSQFDEDRLTRYLRGAIPGLTGDIAVHQFQGGQSNPTFLLETAAGKLVLRRKPAGVLLASAHAVDREYRVTRALFDAGLPVPEPLVLCEDTDVIGAPFFVMERVEGTPYRLASQLEPLGPERTGALAARMVDTLATLHRVDPAQVGLSDFGRPEGFLARQVRRWKKQLDASHSRDVAGADELHHLLEASPPAEGAPAVVHGDFRLDNLLVDQNDQVAAVVDWEMATIGDPLTDLALLLVYHRMAELDTGCAVANASTAPGFPTSEEMVNLYAARSRRDLSTMGFYLGLGYFKLAVILEGIHYRYGQGQTVGAGFETVGAIVEPLVAAGLTAMKEH